MDPGSRAATLAPPASLCSQGHHAHLGGPPVPDHHEREAEHKGNPGGLWAGGDAKGFPELAQLVTWSTLLACRLPGFLSNKEISLDASGGPFAANFLKSLWGQW